MGRGGAADGLFAGKAGVTELAATPDIHTAICGAARLRLDRPARVRHRIEHAQPPVPAFLPVQEPTDGGNLTSFGRGHERPKISAALCGELMQAARGVRMRAGAAPAENPAPGRPRG